MLDWIGLNWIELNWNDAIEPWWMRCVEQPSRTTPSPGAWEKTRTESKGPTKEHNRLCLARSSRNDRTWGRLPSRYVLFTYVGQKVASFGIRHSNRHWHWHSNRHWHWHWHWHWPDIDWLCHRFELALTLAFAWSGSLNPLVCKEFACECECECECKT